ncbi:integumentary mucin C.1-like [Phlebotomus papatasi]|nr:integumentary mucin C.1-like [Phlebotomus papatasi]
MRNFITVPTLLCLIIAALVIRLVDSTCNVCSPTSNISCESETQFRLCSDGLPDANSPLFNCATGTVCNSDTTQYCATGAVPSCQACGTCTADGRFACTGLNTFALCHGGTIPSSDTYTCPINTVCDVNAASPDFCSVDNGSIVTCNPTSTQPPDTTPTTTTTTTTTTSTSTLTPTTSSTTTTPITSTTQSTTTTQSPTDWCADKGTIGRYPHPHDPDCRSYYYCFASEGSLAGSTYFCQGTTVFKPDIQQCVTSTTYQCPDYVTTPIP